MLLLGHSTWHDRLTRTLSELYKGSRASWVSLWWPVLHNNYINGNCLFHLHTCDLLRPWNTWIRMDPASIIKRKRQRIDTSLACFFCQNNAGDLRTASAEGKARTRAIGEQRRQLGDTSYVYVLDGLNIRSGEDFDGLQLRWHKTCYSNFSSESKLQKEALLSRRRYWRDARFSEPFL